MKIIFMGSPAFAVPTLEALHASSHEVVAVVTQPDRPSGRKLQLEAPAVKISAHALGIPVFQPVTTKTPQFLDEIRSFSPDLLVVVAYGEILRPALLEIPKKGAVNLHASLLPKYRGAAPVAWSILHGERETGVTTMFMDQGMDSGPILLQEGCPIAASDTAGTLAKKLAVIGAPLMRKTINQIQDGSITAKPQDVSLVSYAPKLKKEDGAVDWKKNAQWISRQIRAFDPWPGTFSRLNENLIKFWLADAMAEETTSEPPGTVCHISKQAFFIACGEGSLLRIIELQPENRPRMTALDFIHGYKISVGSRFVSGSGSSDD